MKDVNLSEMLTLLKKHRVQFDNRDCRNAKCSVTDFGFKSGGSSSSQPVTCGAKVVEKSGRPGVCDRHYREYIVRLIGENGLDMVDVMEYKELKEMMKQLGIPLLKSRLFKTAAKVLEIMRSRIKEQSPALVLA
jgi:hypothetical protein